MAALGMLRGGPALQNAAQRQPTRPAEAMWRVRVGRKHAHARALGEPDDQIDTQQGRAAGPHDCHRHTQDPQLQQTSATCADVRGCMVVASCPICMGGGNSLKGTSPQATAEASRQVTGRALHTITGSAHAAVIRSRVYCFNTITNNCVFFCDGWHARQPSDSGRPVLISLCRSHTCTTADGDVHEYWWWHAARHRAACINCSVHPDEVGTPASGTWAHPAKRHRTPALQSR